MIIDRPPGAVAGAVRPDLVGRDHEALVLDRAGPQKDLPVISRRRERERGRYRDQLAPAGGEGLVELREAQVVAHRHPHVAAVCQLGHDRRIAGLLVRGLHVPHAVDLDIEHVDLPVDRGDLTIAADVDARVRGLLLIGDPFDDRPGDQVDPELAGRLARPRDGTPVERLRRGMHRLRPAEHRPLLGERDELGAARGRVADEAVGSLEVPIGVFSRVELNGGGAQWLPPPGA